MRKFYALAVAALMSVSIFAEEAQVPTEADLAKVYDLQNNVVLCINFTDEATVCRNIYFVGSPNNWGKGDGEKEAFINCEKFAKVNGFDGWYAAELPYSDGFYGKPIQETQDGNWSWDYQPGDPAAWEFVGGNQININEENGNESSMGYPSAGAYIYKMKYWKKHVNPCGAIVKHNYTITLYAPDACDEMKPGIAGDDLGWTAIAMTEGVDDEFNTIYTYSFEGQEGHGFKILDAKLGWDNEMFYYDTINDEWKKFENIELTADSNIVLDWSDNELYRFAQCDLTPAEYTVMAVNFPKENAPEAIEIIGNFDGWQGTAMEKLESGWYFVELDAKPSQFFKFRSAGLWPNEGGTELEIYDAESAEWKKIADNQLVFGQLWHDTSYKGTPCKSIGDNDEWDLSDPAKYRWSVQEEGIENVVLTEKAQKVVVDGVLYIVRDNKMFNVQGTQVR